MIQGKCLGRLKELEVLAEGCTEITFGLGPFASWCKTFDAKQKQAYLEMVASANASAPVTEAKAKPFSDLLPDDQKAMLDKGEHASPPQPNYSVATKKGGRVDRRRNG